VTLCEPIRHGSSHSSVASYKLLYSLNFTLLDMVLLAVTVLDHSCPWVQFLQPNPSQSKNFGPTNQPSPQPQSNSIHPATNLWAQRRQLRQKHYDCQDYAHTISQKHYDCHDYAHVRYDTIRDAILTCARKPT